MKTKLIDFIPFTEYVMYGGRLIKAQRSITIKRDRPSSYDLPCGS
jgi:hypothetical protein